VTQKPATPERGEGEKTDPENLFLSTREQAEG
jgi:hypothetical protein